MVLAIKSEFGAHHLQLLDPLEQEMLLLLDDEAEILRLLDRRLESTVKYFVRAVPAAALSLGFFGAQSGRPGWSGKSGRLSSRRAFMELRLEPAHFVW